MKAEIGFVRDDAYRATDRMQLVITAQGQTELTALEVFARRAGLVVEPMSGTLTLEERAPKRYATSDGTPIRYHGDDMQVGKGHPLLPPRAIVTAYDPTTGIIDYQEP